MSSACLGSVFNATGVGWGVCRRVAACIEAAGLLPLRRPVVHVPSGCSAGRHASRGSVLWESLERTRRRLARLPLRAVPSDAWGQGTLSNPQQGRRTIGMPGTAGLVRAARGWLRAGVLLAASAAPRMLRSDRERAAQHRPRLSERLRTPIRQHTVTREANAAGRPVLPKTRARHSQDTQDRLHSRCFLWFCRFSARKAGRGRSRTRELFQRAVKRCDAAATACRAQRGTVAGANRVVA